MKLVKPFIVGALTFKKNFIGIRLIYNVGFRCTAALGFKVSSAPGSHPEIQVRGPLSRLWAPLGRDDSLDVPVLVT